MFKKAIKALSVFLALLMAFTTFTVAFAAPQLGEEPVKQNEGANQASLSNLDDRLSGQYPVIILPGISQSQSYFDVNDNDILDEGELSGGMLFIDTSNLVWDAITKLLFPLLFTMIFQKDAFNFTDRIYEFAKDLFWVQASLDDGTNAQNLKTITYDCSVGEMTQEEIDYFFRMIPMKEYADIIGVENVYQFCFPLLGNPVENGKALQDYIDFVKEARGVDKVDLVTLSLGGTVLTSWLDYEGAVYSDVNKIVNVVSLLDGTTVMSDMFARNFNLADKYVYNDFIPMIMDSMNDVFLGYIINLAIRLLPRKVFEDTLTRLLDGVLETFLLNAPQFWAMVPSGKYADRLNESDSMYGYTHYYPELAERYLQEKPILKAKTDRFYEAQLALEDNLLAAADAGVKVYNICGYNLGFDVEDYSFFGIMGSTISANSDALIQIQSTSLGATAATRNTKLPDSYIAQVGSDYISPDGSVDVSTSLFPDTTWLFKDQHHEVGRCDLVLELAIAILVGEVDTVNDMPERYPQFNSGRRTVDLARRVAEAEKLLADPESIADGTYDALLAAYNEGVALLDSYIGNREEAARVTALITKAVAEAKGETYTAPNENLTIGQKFIKFLNDFVFKTIGAKGFFD